jgi:hypothetical protein
MISYVRLGYFRLGLIVCQVRSGYFMIIQVSSGKVKIGQFISCYVRFSQVSSG